MQPESCIPLQPCGLKKRPSREVPNLNSDRERDHPIVETQDNLQGRSSAWVLLSYSIPRDFCPCLEILIGEGR